MTQTVWTTLFEPTEVWSVYVFVEFFFEDNDSAVVEKIVDGCMNQYSKVVSEKCITSLFESAYFWAK